MKVSTLIKSLAGSLAALAVVISSVPSPAHGELLSLDECIEIALKNNPDIHVAAQNVKKSENNLVYNYGGLLPNVSTAFTKGHVFYGPSSVQYDSQGRPVQNSGFDYDNYSFRITSDMTIFDGMGNISRISAARHGRDSALEQFKYSKDMMAANVIRAYYNLVRNKMLLTVQEESMEQAKQNLERTEALLEVGSATRADVLKAKVRHSNTRLSMISTRNQVELAKADLIAILNRRNDDNIDVDTSLSIDIADLDPGSEIDFAMEHRPDLKGLHHDVRAAQSMITSARSGWWPTLGANFGFYWNDREMAENLNFFKEEYTWNITGYVSLDIFDRFRTRTNVRNAKADHRIAEYNLEKSRLEAIKEIKSLLFGMKEAEERILVATETVEQANEDVRLAEERYRVGAGTMLETIDAQVALTQAKSDVIQAKCDYLVAAADIARATGRMSNY